MSDVRFRHEHKYMIDAIEESLIQIKADGLLKRDPYTGKSGKYIVRSLYFDDYDDSCLDENLSGTDIRSKYRIRYYNNDPERLSLEKKSKNNGMCLKKSCLISKDEYALLISGQEVRVDINDKNLKIKTELFNEMRLKNLIPKVIVTYERIPYIYEAGNVRITIDGNITSGYDIDRFLMGNYEVRPVLKSGESILEVKWDEVLPVHIRKTLQIDKYNRTAFSKYYMCRQFHL